MNDALTVASALLWLLAFVAIVLKIPFLLWFRWALSRRDSIGYIVIDTTIIKDLWLVIAVGIVAMRNLEKLDPLPPWASFLLALSFAMIVWITFLRIVHWLASHYLRGKRIE